MLLPYTRRRGANTTLFLCALISRSADNSGLDGQINLIVIHSYLQKKRDYRFPDSPLADPPTLAGVYLLFFTRSTNTNIGKSIRNKRIYILFLRY